MSLIVNLNDPNLWTPVWELDVSAQTLGSDVETDSYIRIPEQKCPIILHKSLLAVYASNPLAKPGWFSAGYLSQSISLPLTVGGSPTSYASSRRIILGRTQIVPFLDIGVADFAIAFLCHRWHRQIKLVVWEYQGNVSTTELTAIAALSQQLNSIESKIDSL
ncbi:hypothetical protein [Microcoleus asticus]|uniref:Uncharacterized protein n=1 Tax=Microcoleus asticus IPMA8 TaxID=2563858 RepID=A0ABX2D4G4_9CYAN|nr:hypothetical protein [Microcoleus asticus]NQE37537.1 hypothetical protein [Microcoleus asticus IPMA8]